MILDKLRQPFFYSIMPAEDYTKLKVYRDNNKVIFIAYVSAILVEIQHIGSPISRTNKFQ